MDKKKKVNARWIWTLCLFILSVSSLHAQNVNRIDFCGSSTSNDSITLYLKFVDQQGKRINSLDPAKVRDGYLTIRENNTIIPWEKAKFEQVKSGKRIPKGFTFSVLIDLNIPAEGKSQIYDIVKQLIESAPDSSVYISFFGDEVGESSMVTSQNYQSFRDKFMQAAHDKYFCSAVYSKLAEFNSSTGEYENLAQLAEGYNKNPEIARRAAANKGKNLLFVFTDATKNAEPEVDINYGEITEYQRDKSHDVPTVYAFYYTGNGAIDELVEMTLRGITIHEDLDPGRRGDYKSSTDMSSVLRGFQETIADQMYDYTFSYKPEGRVYNGSTNFTAEWLTQEKGKSTFSIGSPENPWPVYKETTSDAVKKYLMALLITLLTIAFFFLIIKVLIPWIKSKAFAAKYYKKYVPEANVQRRICHYCKQDLQPGQVIVTKCKHYMHIHCWKLNHYKCSEYGQNCNIGIQDHVEFDHLFTKSSLRDCQQTIAGILAGLVSWIIYELLGRGSFFKAMATAIVKTFYKASEQQIGMFDKCVDKVSSFLAIGLLLGFFLSLVFRYNDEYRKKDWKIYLKIFGLSLLSGVIGMLAFAIGACILCALLSVTHATDLPWYCSLPAYLLFSICVSLSLTIKSSVPVKSAMIGGVCSSIIGFLVLYFSRFTSSSMPWMNMLLDFIIYGGGLGASLVTVRMLAEKYFLVIQNGVKAGQRIPIHKWMSATGGGNKVSIGMTGECEIQMNWEKSNKVAKEHAQLFIDQARKLPMIKPLATGVIYNTRAELPVGKPSVLSNGDTFKIGDTTFQYVENE